jgi:catechol 2,3-dioxygenase-like lactoylglutathione lyase family enzyme
MLSHVSIGVKNLAKARSFYDAALKPLGYKCVAEDSGYVFYGAKSPEFGILEVKQPVPANPESGLHFCFEGQNRADVDAFYAAALNQGGKDNGKPGLRADYGENYYAAFVVDPDGYRVEAYTSAK